MQIKLGDFGIAKILNSQTEFANTVIGTPYYLSPELCEDKPYNSKSDVWALGCVLYEVTTLKHAFNGQNLPALVLKILRVKYPPIPTHYSENLRKLIARTLNKSPELRPSMEEILKLPFLQSVVQKYYIPSRKVITPPMVSVSLVESSDTPPSSAPPHSKKKTPIPKRQPSIAEKPSDEKEWHDDRQKELENMYNALHPSKRNPIDHETKQKVESEIAGRKEGQSERAKRRKEELRMKFKDENRRIVTDNVEIRKSEPSPTPMLPSPSPSPPPKQPIKIFEPKVQQQQPQKQPVKQPVPQQPQKQQPISKPQKAEVFEADIKEQKNKERQQYFDKITGSDIKEKKKQFLLNKQKEKDQAKEAELARKKEHDKKMKEIKARAPLMRVNKSSNDFVEPEPIPVKDEPKPVEKNFEQEQKEKEREDRLKQAAEKRENERKNFLNFIKQQKHQKPQPSDDQDDDILVADGKKKTYSEALTSSLTKPVPAEIVSEVKVEPKKEPPPKKEIQKKSSWIDNMKKQNKGQSAEEDVQIFAKDPPPRRVPVEQPKPKVEIKVAEPEPVKQERAQTPEPVARYKPKPEPEPEPEPEPVQALEPLKQSRSTEHDEESALSVEPPRNSKIHSPTSPGTPTHTEILDRVLVTTQKTEEQTAKEKLSVRIEYLRQYCEKRFGEDLFMKVYRFLRQVSDDDDDMETHEKLQLVLGDKFATHYPYVQKIQHLIFCEDSFYG
jgi:NIMA (never in mitosis gene a)-related kinase